MYKAKVQIHKLETSKCGIQPTVLTQLSYENGKWHDAIVICLPCNRNESLDYPMSMGDQWFTGEKIHHCWGWVFRIGCQGFLHDKIDIRYEVEKIYGNNGCRCRWIELSGDTMEETLDLWDQTMADLVFEWTNILSNYQGASCY